MRLLASPFSEKLISEVCPTAIFCEDLLDVAEEDDICFVEDRALIPHVSKIHRLIIYRWNRTYPYDFSLDLLPLSEEWRLVKTEELIGSSHEKITKEIYLK